MPVNPLDGYKDYLATLLFKESGKNSLPEGLIFAHQSQARDEEMSYYNHFEWCYLT
ncbi:MAG: hypothetical protein AB7W16_24190 [Candidatus Obscuribacterales bacterium]